MTGIAGLLFAVIDPSASYWAYGFPSAIVSVFGADFVFPSGTLFVAKVSLPHEQSLAGGMFQTLTQVFLPNLVSALITQRRSPAWDCYGTRRDHYRARRYTSTRSTERVDRIVLQACASRVQSGTVGRLRHRNYRYATCRLFGIYFKVPLHLQGSILAATFLRGVGPVGHRKDVDKLTESFSEGFQTHTQDSNSSFAVGKSSSVLVPSLEITRYKNNPLSESSSNKVSPESLYMVWKQPDSKKGHEKDNGRDSMYFFVA